MIKPAVPKSKKNFTYLFDLLLIVVLLVGGYFRLTGSDWGQLNIQHPDEDFMVSVTLGLRSVHSVSEYFNTAQSTLNPAVVGYPAYVYGTLPLFIVHYIVESFGKLNTVTLLGRQLSAVADLGTIALLYFIVKRFYKERVAVLAAAFSALTVMQIQQSHFYTTDNFSTFFMFLTLSVAAVIATGKWNTRDDKSEAIFKNASISFQFWQSILRLSKDPLTYLTIAFGITLGMAVASKLNAVAIAVVLPIALAVRYFNSPHHVVPVPALPSESLSGHKGKFIQTFEPGDEWVKQRTVEDYITKAFFFLVLGAVIFLVAFRVFQPYAFSGPGFFDIKLNPEWVQKIREQLLQANPNTDLPWALQWARRNHLYSFQNLTVWGLGLPLGILAWVGFLWMGWRMLKGEFWQHILLWSWTAIYFFWQSLQYNPTMRYQLPIYPLLGMMASYAVFNLARRKIGSSKHITLPALFAAILGGSVLLLTAVYAYAFSRIYVRSETRIAASNWIFQNVPGPINLQILGADGNTYRQPMPYPSGMVIQPGLPYQTVFVSRNDGALVSILLEHVSDSYSSGMQTLRVILSTSPDPLPGKALADMAVTANFTPTGDQRGIPVTLTPPGPVSLRRGITYYLQIQTTGGEMTLVGSAIANETDYDYPLPFRTASYDPFGGIYRGDLNLQVYYPDDAVKFDRLQSVLDQTDYIFIPTNHQYAQITRLPERYPLTTEYYRQLIGCPAEKDIIWCYRVSEPGMFHGNLGFDLVATFESYPSIGSLVINDQSAEEAFTFYDHPKVIIFQKNADYNPALVKSVLGTVDYNHAIHLTPGQADTYKSLMLPGDKLAVQQEGGTWSDLFDLNTFYNRYPAFGLMLWYLVIFILGLIIYPLVRATFPGLPDHGYPLARIVGLLLWAWLAWIAGSIGLNYSRLTIGIALGLIILIGLWQAWRQRVELVQEFRQRWKYFLMVEVVFLAFFLFDLLIRLGNPDLWHSSKGGERPMEFAYFNAILKSSTFPPYDPWFAGGYINYYYFGYVIVGTPVKLLGIVPSIAFNLILPTLFACLAAGAFSVGWNLFTKYESSKPALCKTEDLMEKEYSFHPSSFIPAISASAAMVLLGNLGIVRLLYQGFQRVAVPNAVLESASIFQRIWWAIKGFFMVLAGMHLPYGPGDWYWFSSRIFPPGYNEFFEFPAFSFIWSDLHAHVISLMLTVLVISWVLSVLLAKARWDTPTNAIIGFFMGGLIIGSLKPTNTWDFYTYIIFGGVVLAYTVWRYSNPEKLHLPLPGWGKRFLLTSGAAVLLTAFSILLYHPFSQWFGQAYSSASLWTGPRTPMSTYLTQWGVFLFFIVSWMTWETRQWLAETPVSALRKLRPYRDLILGAVVLIVIVLVAQQIWVMLPNQTPAWKGVTILWLALPLAVWAAILLFRPGITDLKRLVLFMTGTGLLLTMMVELIVIAGDIGRFNTVFKFGLQSWVLLGLCAAASFGWLLTEFRKWLPGWRTFWSVTATLLVTASALFLVIGGADKIRDRMNPAAPHTLDSMTYMDYAFYANYGVDMDLSEDYRAIRWMQANIQGSPVIVEAAAAGVQYSWHSRFSIYTGLPDIVGWEFHQTQQRVLDSAAVIARGREVDVFYATDNLALARDFLRKYNVRYIIIGQLERAKYAPGAPNGPVHAGEPDGLLKFDQLNGVFWNEVYRDGQAVIFEVPMGAEVPEGSKLNP
jgi:YYY domain-containing protein